MVVTASLAPAGHAMQQSIMMARVGFVQKVKEVWSCDEPRVSKLPESLQGRWWCVVR